MGKGAPDIPTSPLEKALADIAKKQQKRAEMLQTGFEDPLRTQMQPMIAQALGQNPFSTKLSAADRGAYEGQYNQAKQNIMNTAGPGGMLRSQLAGLERDRANAISGAASQARQTGLQRALGGAAGTLPGAQITNALSGQAASSMGSAANMASSRNLAQAQMNNAEKGAKGSGIGSLVGMLGKGAMSMMSSRDFKDDIVPYKDDVLAQIEATPIYSWRYKGDGTQHIGPVTEESPPILVTEDGKALISINYLGFLFAAVKALNAKVAALEAR